MDLQHQQLQQLTDWLDVTEARIKRMGAQPLGPDLEDVKHQVEEHKVGSCWLELYFLKCGSTQRNHLEGPWKYRLFFNNLHIQMSSEAGELISSVYFLLWFTCPGDSDT